MYPKLQLILEYKHFFGSEPPKNRLDLIKNIPKRNLLIEIAGLNYRLKPANQLKYDVSLDTQRKELRYFCPIDDDLHQEYVSIASYHAIDDKNFPLIFTRASNLFAIEEIINSQEFNEDNNFDMKKIEVWDSIFRYLLAVNKEIAKIKTILDKEITIEQVSASSLVLNELMIEDNPLFLPYRGLKLIEFLSNDDTYGDEINHYFNDILKIEKDRFVFNILALAMINSKLNKFSAFAYNVNEADRFLDYLSLNRINNDNPITLLSTKKTPFYKDSALRYIILDLNFLINKSYSFFINDFWFDFLKPQKNPNGKERYKFKNYRGKFGLFFESYVEDILRKSFSFLKYPVPFLFDDLKVKTPNGQIEIADIYLRQNKKILVGQVKSSSIYDKEKLSGNIDILYRQNREQFFVDFGVNQTLQSIKDVLVYYDSFDSKLKVDKKLTFYPIVVVNEKLFQTPLLSNLLYIRFEELIANEDFENHKINPLTVIHISELEYLENALSKKKLKIWNLLESHYGKIKDSLMPPFIQTVDKHINPGVIPERAMESFKKIIAKYSKGVD